MLAHPAATFAHVQKQAVVEAAQQVHLELRALLADHMRIRHRTAEHAGVGAHLVAVLEHQIQGLIGHQFCPAGRERGLNGRQHLVAHRLVAGQQQNRGIPVQRPLLATRVQTAAAVEEALGVQGQRHRGDGVEQGLWGHGSAGAG
jgi:hypothetical protein